MTGLPNGFKAWHLVLAAALAVLAVIGTWRVSQEDRVSVDGETLFRGDTDRRIKDLEDADKELVRKLDRHAETDVSANEKRDERIRQLELAVKDLDARLRTIEQRHHVSLYGGLDGVVARTAPPQLFGRQALEGGPK